MSLVSKIADGFVRLTQIVKGKQDTLVSGSNIKTINGQSIVASGDLAVTDDRKYITYQEYAAYSNGATLIGTGVGYTGSAVMAGTFSPLNNVQNKPAYGYQQTTASATAVVRISGGNFCVPMLYPTYYQSSAFLAGALATVASHRFAFGLINAVPTTDVNPSTFLNCLMVACDSTDTTIQIMHNDGAGACTKINTGWVKPTLANQYHYFLQLKTNPAAGTVSYEARRWKSTDFSEDVFTGTISSNLLANNIAVAFFSFASAGGTSSTAQIQMGRTVLKSWIE